MSCQTATSGLDQTLSGLRVLEIGHYVAAPFCTRLLGDLGADVIKVEPPKGDPARQWGEQVEDQSLWWSMHARNKRSVVVDLKSTEGKEIILKLLSSCDVLVENFRPGQLDKLGFSEGKIKQVNPKIIIARISGYGQTGPYRDRAAFGVIGEAIGGLRYLTNNPVSSTNNTPPVRVGVSIGDSIAGLYAAFGVMAALWQRDRVAGDGKARSLDVALTESILSMMEAMLPEYGALGKIKQPTGGAIATAAPSNAYPTSDGHWTLIAANSDPLFKKLARLIGLPELADDALYIGNPERVANAQKLDHIISTWTQTKTADQLETLLNDADIPNSRAYTAEDIANDPQYRDRGMVQEVEDPLFKESFGKVMHAGVVPFVPESPGAVRWSGPAIGQHTDEVLQEFCGYTVEDIKTLRAKGVTA